MAYLTHHAHHNRHRQDVSAGFDFSNLNPIPHLKNVNSLATAKQELPWILGTGSAIAGAWWLWKHFRPFGKKGAKRR